MSLNHDELARLLVAEGIHASAMATFCTTPDGALLHLPVLQTHAQALWERLRALVPSTGYWPVLRLSYASMGWSAVHTRVEVETLAARSAQAVVDEAGGVDLPAWLDARQAEHAGDPADPDEADAQEALIGSWSSNRTAKQGFWIVTAQLPSPWLELRLVPTSVAWHVPAFFTYGNGPRPAEHVAILQAWHRRYGAEIVTSAGDTVEMSVSRPPRTRKAAWTLAFDHFAYCPDVVRQGTLTIGRLAASLLNCDKWYFWWD